MTSLEMLLKQGQQALIMKFEDKVVTLQVDNRRYEEEIIKLEGELKNAKGVVERK